MLVGKRSPLLLRQLRRYRPRTIVGGGAKVRSFTQQVAPRSEPLQRRTCYVSNVAGVDVLAALSGFIGRIDNYSRARHGAEIERIAKRIGSKAADS